MHVSGKLGLGGGRPMSRDVFDELAAHFTSVAEQLSTEARQAGLLKNSSAVGTNREEVYKSFLERHVPKSCEVFLGAYIFDMQGRTSSQIDVVVTNGNTPRFQMAAGSSFIAPLEGTIAVAEVKSSLDKDGLEDALTKCASIPAMPNSQGILAPILRLDEAIWQDMPFKVVFAYGGLEADTLLNHVNAFYENHPEIPVARRPNVIHVLGKYALIKLDSTMTILDEQGNEVSFEPNTGAYRVESVAPDVSAMLWVLNYLQEKSVLYNNVLFKYSSWHTEIMTRIIGAVGIADDV